MVTLRQIAPLVGLAAALSAATLHAQSAPPQGGPDPLGAGAAQGPGAHEGHHHPEGGPLGEMGGVLHQLNLTEDQRSRIKSILASQKSQFEALRASSRANRQALAGTPPTDPNYEALIQSAQSNAGAFIKLMGETWKQVYENVLTQPQRDQIPALVAAAEAAHRTRMEQWKAEHPQPPP